MLKGRVENNCRKPKGLTKNRHGDSLKKSELTLPNSMMKKGDVVVIADDDDDEVRTSVP